MVAKTKMVTKPRSNKLEVARDPNDGYFYINMFSGNGRVLMRSVPYEFKSQAITIAKSIRDKRNWEIVDREAA